MVLLVVFKSESRSSPGSRHQGLPWYVSWINVKSLHLTQLTALERTFLAHFKTSTSFALLSTFFTQGFILNDSRTPQDGIQSHLFEIAMSVFCIVAAVLFSLIGCYRFMRAQRNLLQNQRIVVGGWDLMTESIIVGLVSLSLDPR